MEVTEKIFQKILKNPLTNCPGCGNIQSQRENKEEKKMRTCKNCGCYLPDNWITCPACFTNVNEQPKVKKITYKETESHESLHFTVCRVDLYHKNNTKSSNLFASYENAVKFAHHMTCRADVAVVIVTDVKSGKIIEKFSRKGY